MKLTIILLLISFSTCLPVGTAFAQKLEKMPADLETDFALSSLPPHLRSEATIYLLDPDKGYYVARKGSNGFSCMVLRTEWEWEEFIDDCFTAISFDAEGSKTIVPVYLDVATMRASGKYTPSEIKKLVVKRVKDGTYKGPSHTGISYMLAPMMRSHPGTKEIVNMIMPHYMFYSGKLTNADIGGKNQNTSQPFILENDPAVVDYGIFNFIILAAGEAERTNIVKENADLLRRLAEFRPALKLQETTGHH
jgi:hypothetical protein